MRYILKYKIKSRYFGFVREYMKEFDSKLKAFNFIINNQVIEWQLYKRMEEYLYTTELVKGSDNNE